MNLLTLKEACDGPLRGLCTPRTLLNAIQRGTLTAHRVGRFYTVSPEALAAWRDQCRVLPKEPVSNSKPTTAPAVKPNGLSETERGAFLQALLEDRLQRQSVPCGTTSGRRRSASARPNLS